MALRGSRIENFDELWCLGASRGLEFCVSSTSFSKSKIDCPQQPPKSMDIRQVSQIFICLVI